MSKKLTEREIEEFLANSDLSESDTDPYRNSEDEDPTWASLGSENESASDGGIQSSSSDVSAIEPESSYVVLDNQRHNIPDDSDIQNVQASPQTASTTSYAPDNIIWYPIPQNYTPKIQLPDARDTEILLNSINSQSSEIDIFLKLFPKSLYMYISQCTNQRLTILERKTKKKVKLTDYSEIMMMTGVMMVMAYNTLPSLNCYWSKHPSMGNTTIKNAMSRDRYKLLISKLYFNNPEKPTNCSKIYYVEELLECFKYTYQQARTDSTFQSIDESMAKFKGRSSLKQYLPLKPIKRGIKLWVRSDSLTGYVYDLNVYSGKENGQADGTVGERVVRKLTSSIRSTNVVICFDRFFTSVTLMKTLSYAAVGTCIASRKNIPKSQGKLEKGEAKFLCTNDGITFTRWQDTKEVLAISNCHGNQLTFVDRKQKNGEKLAVACPEIISFYNKYMGGVDLTDHLSGLYEFDRKSTKWWKKVFYKLLMITAVNASIIYNEVTGRKIPFLDFLVALAESLIEQGKSKAGVKRRSTSGRPSKRQKKMLNVGDHMPIVEQKRRRCTRCSQRKIEKRTKTVCRTCCVPLCNECFTAFHM